VVLAIALRRLEVEVGEHHRSRRRRVRLRHRLRPASGGWGFSVSSGCGFRSLDSSLTTCRAWMGSWEQGRAREQRGRITQFTTGPRCGHRFNWVSLD
jgi:hypothetical protein